MSWTWYVSQLNWKTSTNKRFDIKRFEGPHFLFINLQSPILYKGFPFRTCSNSFYWCILPQIHFAIQPLGLTRNRKRFHFEYWAPWIGTWILGLETCCLSPTTNQAKTNNINAVHSIEKILVGICDILCMYT